MMAQGTAKLWPVKFVHLKKIANYGQKNQTYLIKYSLELKMSDFFFRPPTLTGHSFAVP